MNTKVLAVIPARGGSKGVPRKNIRMLGGKPLIAWTIEAAKQSKVISKVICSTDDLEIAGVAREYGCEVPYIRDGKLAEDTTPMIDVVLDVLNRCEGYDWVILLQPTSPLRTSQDIDNLYQYACQYDATSCASVSLVDKSPYWMFSLLGNGKLRPILQQSIPLARQEAKPVYNLNGAIYYFNVNWLSLNTKIVSNDTIGFPIKKEHAVDIDTEYDFIYAEYILGANKKCNLIPEEEKLT